MDSDSDSEPEISKFLSTNNEDFEMSATDIIKLKRKGSSTDLINPNPKDFDDTDESNLSEKIIMSSLPESVHFKCSEVNSDSTDDPASELKENISTPKDVNHRTEEDNTECSNSTIAMNMDNVSEISAEDLKLLQGKSDNDPMKAMKETHCETVAIIKCAMQDIFGKAICQASLAACSAFSLIKRESARMVTNFKNMLDEETVCPLRNRDSCNSRSGTKVTENPKAKSTQYDDCICRKPKLCDNYTSNVNEETKSNND